MKVLSVFRVRCRDAAIPVADRLGPFLANWLAVQQGPDHGIAERFWRRLPIGPGSFNVTPAFAMNDLRCR